MFYSLLVECIEVRQDNSYTVMVFKDTNNGTLVMCTKLPNWDIPTPKIGDIGYLQVKEVGVGDQYIEAPTGQIKQYLYENVYFWNFLHLKENIEEIIL